MFICYVLLIIIKMTNNKPSLNAIEKAIVNEDYTKLEVFNIIEIRRYKYPNDTSDYLKLMIKHDNKS